MEGKTAGLRDHPDTDPWASAIRSNLDTIEERLRPLQSFLLPQPNGWDDAVRKD